ncbi:glutamate--cysteine ligase [Candidatus Liberibacter americanus]|uniref:Glutamate--cysteine ligase n=1 Tax=Candidatus Liberibacter americanus str. Sao Paulo TaxID=1261131 RepID=U6B505_9HYPH|nr:glutamate--cysteine ligase [Candidatus Liberibacter americanus]AHA28154.1 Gamma-glutamylcysteine synthetase [Candidatus Liberibacter americanus str. Sao Paulo]EMS35934.1 glutamate--cysteine ligase [Candidatus Liberibacter americanus PW_SP]
MISNLSRENIVISIEDLVNHIASGVKSKHDLYIGAEHESFIFSQKDNSPVPYKGERSIETILSNIKKKLIWEPIMDQQNLIGLKDPFSKAAISLEPGGQFELSSTTLKNIHQIKEEMFKYIKNLKEVTNDLDMKIMGMGANPKWKISEIPIIPKSRYKIMKEYMPQIGTSGLDMMFRTCTTQVSLDFHSEKDMAVKLRVSLKLQPIITAIFASSPFTEKKINGFQSWRSEIWINTDKNRTGIIPYAFENNFGFEDYTQWALDIPMYFVIRDDQYYKCTNITFRQFINGALKGKIKQWHATIEDWENHLSTLFPDVRLRNCLEMRGADSGRPEQILAISAFWTGILYDDSALQEVNNLTSEWSFDDINKLRYSVTHKGIRSKIKGQYISSIADKIINISRNGLRNRGHLNHRKEDETIFLKPIEKIINENKSPADEMINSYHGKWKESVEPCFEEYTY